MSKKCLNKFFFNILLIIVYPLPFYFHKKKNYYGFKNKDRYMCTMYIHNLFAFVFGFFRSINIFLYFPLPRFSPDSINVGPFNLQNNQSQYGKEKRKHTVPNRTSFLSPLSLSLLPLLQTPPVPPHPPPLGFSIA